MATTKKSQTTTMVKDLQKAVDDAENALKTLAKEGGDEAGELKDKIEEIFTKAMGTLENAEDKVITQGKEALHKAENYVEKNPWQTLGLAGLAGVLLGVLISRK